MEDVHYRKWGWLISLWVLNLGFHSLSLSGVVEWWQGLALINQTVHSLCLLVWTLSTTLLDYDSEISGIHRSSAPQLYKSSIFMLHGSWDTGVIPIKCDKHDALQDGIRKNSSILTTTQCINTRLVPLYCWGLVHSTDFSIVALESCWRCPH